MGFVWMFLLPKLASVLSDRSNQWSPCWCPRFAPRADGSLAFEGWGALGGPLREVVSSQIRVIMVFDSQLRSDVVRKMRLFAVKPVTFGAEYFRTNLSVEYYYLGQIMSSSSRNLMQCNEMRPRNYKSESC